MRQGRYGVRYAFTVGATALAVGACTGSRRARATDAPGPAGAAIAMAEDTRVVPCERADPPWQRVAVGRLTFCVPGGWEQRGPLSWASATGRVTFDTTGWTPPIARATPTAKSVNGVIGVERPARGPEYERQRTERIGGATAELWEARRLDGQLLTRAGWPQRGVVFHGESMTPTEAAQQLEVYRTVRFGGRSGPGSGDGVAAPMVARWR